MLRNPCVYILANRKHGALYTGVSSHLMQRLSQHRDGEHDSFAKRYGITRLVYVEFHETMEAAIVREKQIKSWRRAWKIQLIEETNPDWEDLASQFLA